MKLRSTNKARKVKLFWEKHARVRKLKLRKQKRSTVVIPNTNNGFMKMWGLPTIRNVFSCVIVPVITDMIFKYLGVIVNI